MQDGQGSKLRNLPRYRHAGFGLQFLRTGEGVQRMYQVPPVFARLTEQHQAVMEAIVAGDAEAARQAMMGHLGFVHATIKRFDEDQARQARITRLPGDHNENSRENS